MIFRMKPVDYKGELWSSHHELHPALLDLVASRDCLVSIAHGDPPYQVVIGVPHQAAIGEDWIAENSSAGRRPSDENAASFAVVTFNSLREQDVPCKLVIAAHATDHDPNKIEGSPYWQSIFAADTRLLCECHGAAGHRHHTLEVTAGSNRRTDPRAFGRLLAQSLGYRYLVVAQAEAGTLRAVAIGAEGTETADNLELSAVHTHSLIEAGSRGIPALHIEAKPVFRKPQNGSISLTVDGLILGRAIADSITWYLGACVK